jgi:isopropylmalate/homocitrate/citramalate synthase
VNDQETCLTGDLVVNDAAASLLYSWNPVPSARYASVRIEDDVREALQNVRVHRPTVEQRKHMLELSTQVGVDVTFLGFPAASHTEREQCTQLVAHIGKHSLPQTPVLMARTVPSDLWAIIDIQQRTSVQVLVDLYLSTSPLRTYVEKWSTADMLGQLIRVAERATAEGIAFRIAFEDSTRTPPHVLTTCVSAALNVGAKSIVLNDTAGDCTPAGAARHTRFVADLIAESGVDAELAWHGHNDKGLALANSLAAIESGADLISGTFTGLGERSGNLALEQLIVILAYAGNTRFHLSKLMQMCELAATSSQVEIPHHLPIVGADAFSTSTGTHATAVLKARALGADFEDRIYSAVSATHLERRQELLLGPNSGRFAARAFIEQFAPNSTDEDIKSVLAYCKSQNTTLRTQRDIQRALQVVQTPATSSNHF